MVSRDARRRQGHGPAGVGFAAGLDPASLFSGDVLALALSASVMTGTVGYPRSPVPASVLGHPPAQQIAESVAVVR